MCIADLVGYLLMRATSSACLLLYRRYGSRALRIPTAVGPCTRHRNTLECFRSCVDTDPPNNTEGVVTKDGDTESIWILGVVTYPIQPSPSTSPARYARSVGVGPVPSDLVLSSDVTSEVVVFTTLTHGVYRKLSDIICLAFFSL